MTIQVACDVLGGGTWQSKRLELACSSARDQNKPQDLMGTPAEIGQGNLPGAPLGSAERPICKTRAIDVPHYTAAEPSYHRKAPVTRGKEDASYKQAVSAFTVSPTADADQQ